VETKLFTGLMTLCVILNTIVLALYHHDIDPDMEAALD
jgi:hypothetical protein